MRDAFLAYWRGILIGAVLTVATLWLAASGRLGLYIHPRYFAFTVAMVGVGAVVILAAFLLRRRGEAADHGHGGAEGILDEGHEHPRAPRWRARLAVGGSAALVAASAIALLALPPTTLSASLAADREVNAAIGIDEGDAVVLVGGDTSAFTVKDWAILIRQAGAAPALRSAEPTIIGFVVPIEGNPDAFAIARYAITCCAVDAQPFGVAVLMPGWEGRFAPGDWVSASGRFVENPDASATAEWALQAAEVAAIEEPSDPYVF